MVITKLEQKDKRRIFLYGDGTYLTTVDPALCERLHLREGLEVEGDALEQLLFTAQVRKARERALHLLDGRAYCRKQLYDKVCTTNSKEATQAALDELEQVGLVDDLAFARLLAQEYTTYKGIGRFQVIAKLRQKGLSSQTIEQALEDFVFNEAEAAAQLIRQRYLPRLSDPKGRKQVCDALARKGYSYAQIKEAVAICREEIPEPADEPEDDARHEWG